MTAFTFNTGVPATNNDPSVDQPDMLTNNVSSNAILAVDHISYNSAGSGGSGASGGQHKQVTFNDKAAPGAMVDPIAIEYTANGVANATHPQLYYKNSQGVFPQSAIRAFGSFVTLASGTNPTLTNSFNVTATSHTTTSSYVFTLATNSINTDNAIVLPYVNGLSSIAPQVGAGLTYTLVGGVLTLNVGNISAGITVNFLVIQI